RQQQPILRVPPHAIARYRIELERDVHRCGGSLIDTQVIDTRIIATNGVITTPGCCDATSILP
ncbi:MAG TPA: hypothetical protein VJM34_16625, partial [Novosphingobium sp.]|nr:hypothetical protein [Novosphingobium sp.]